MAACLCYSHHPACLSISPVSIAFFNSRFFAIYFFNLFDNISSFLHHIWYLEFRNFSHFHFDIWWFDNAFTISIFLANNFPIRFPLSFPLSFSSISSFIFPRSMSFLWLSQSSFCISSILQSIFFLWFHRLSCLQSPRHSISWSGLFSNNSPMVYDFVLAAFRMNHHYI